MVLIWGGGAYVFYSFIPNPLVLESVCTKIRLTSRDRSDTVYQKWAYIFWCTIRLWHGYRSANRRQRLRWRFSHLSWSLEGTQIIVCCTQIFTIQLSKSIGKSQDQLKAWFSTKMYTFYYNMNDYGVSLINGWVLFPPKKCLLSKLSLFKFSPNMLDLSIYLSIYAHIYRHTPDIAGFTQNANTPWGTVHHFHFC